MAFPFYISPEQVARDKAEFARKGIARGRSLVALEYADGILILAENPSRALRKISEVYDRIAFAAAGRYNEFESLRVMGIRLADMTGYSNSREDVNGRALANVYAQQLGAIFTTELKPYEVELILAEVGETSELDRIYRVLYDGSLQDEKGYAVLGGNAETVAGELESSFEDFLELETALKTAALALDKGDPTRKLISADLEAAVLDRTSPSHRKFRRLAEDEISSLLGDAFD